jgi:transposase
MINADKRKAIYLLHIEGLGVREISRKFNVSCNSATQIIHQKGEMPEIKRKDTIVVDSDLLRTLYEKCDGYVQRIHEILEEEEGINIGYSTLTRNIRELGLGSSKKVRCDQVPDEPGVEMQHDTSDFKIHFGDNPARIKIIGSVIYLRYSKLHYLKFYRSFNRFSMKCFINEALLFWGYSAQVCIIDNTNLARLRGTGKNAVINPEMKEFSKQYGFKFICHEVMHSNRKAGNERSFYTVETNFLPGRSFKNLEDLNKQAFDWATDRRVNRPVGKTKLIPAKMFEFEKSFLNKLLPYIEQPYLDNKRDVDQYGYIAYDGNFYWVPGVSRYTVTVLRYCSYLVVYHKKEKLVEYQLPDYDIKNKKFSPPGEPKPRHQPHSRKKPTEGEEKCLRALSDEVNEYMDFVLTMKGKPRHRFVRQLYILQRKTALSLFIKSIKRALKFNITRVDTVEKIIVMLMKESNYEFESPDVDWEFKKRESYIDGRFTQEVDLSKYNNWGDDNEG